MWTAKQKKIKTVAEASGSSSHFHYSTWYNVLNSGASVCCTTEGN